MIDTIYIEREVAAHPRAQQICARFPEAVQIACDRYSEIFNRKAQNFRLQKRRPALILANKFDHYILEA
ncbi:MAG: DNA photolyase, partial [Gammaproteobacteria bacterium]